MHVCLRHCNCSTHFCPSNRRLCFGPTQETRARTCSSAPKCIDNSLLRPIYSIQCHRACCVCQCVRVCQCVCLCVSEWPQRGWGVKVHFTSKLACAFFSVGIATSASYSLLFCCSLVLLWFRRFTAAVLSISCVIFSIIYVCACLCTIVCFCFPPLGRHTHTKTMRDFYVNSLCM